jgi:hypothetical protein
LKIEAGNETHFSTMGGTTTWTNHFNLFLRAPTSRMMKVGISLHKCILIIGMPCVNIYIYILSNFKKIYVLIRLLLRAAAGPDRLHPAGGQRHVSIQSYPCNGILLRLSGQHLLPTCGERQSALFHAVSLAWSQPDGRQIPPARGRGHRHAGLDVNSIVIHLRTVHIYKHTYIPAHIQTNTYTQT